MVGTKEEGSGLCRQKTKTIMHRRALIQPPKNESFVMMRECASGGASHQGGQVRVVPTEDQKNCMSLGADLVAFWLRKYKPTHKK